VCAPYPPPAVSLCRPPTAVEAARAPDWPLQWRDAVAGHPDCPPRICLPPYFMNAGWWRRQMPTASSDQTTAGYCEPGCPSGMGGRALGQMTAAILPAAVLTAGGRSYPP